MCTDFIPSQVSILYALTVSTECCAIRLLAPATPSGQRHYVLRLTCEHNISETPTGNFFKFGPNVQLNSTMTWLDFRGQRSWGTDILTSNFVQIFLLMIPPPPSLLSHGPLHHAVAVPAPPAGGPAAASPDLMDGGGRRVQAAGRWGGRPTVGAPQEQAQHELRQTEPSAEILLRQGTSTTNNESHISDWLSS